MKKSDIALLIVIIPLIFYTILFFAVTKTGREVWNEWFHGVQVTDDATSYETRKTVEDTCRAMIAAYQADGLAYAQYKSADSQTRQEWADQAKMRANKTAIMYNEYMLKNRYIWSSNVPDDIKSELPIIE